jgi:hypothetical protein
MPLHCNDRVDSGHLCGGRLRNSSPAEGVGLGCVAMPILSSQGNVLGTMVRTFASGRGRRRGRQVVEVLVPHRRTRDRAARVRTPHSQRHAGALLRSGTSAWYCHSVRQLMGRAREGHFHLAPMPKSRLTPSTSACIRRPREAHVRRSPRHRRTRSTSLPIPVRTAAVVDPRSRSNAFYDAEGRPSQLMA